MMKLGIDYGTTTTLISLTRKEGERSFTRLLDIGGNRKGYLGSSIPSIIAIKKDGSTLSGYAAEELIVRRGEDAVILKSLKRCLNCDRTLPPGKNKCNNPMASRYCVGKQEFYIFDKKHKAKSLISDFIKYLFKTNTVSSCIKDSKLSTVGIAVPANFSSDPRHTIYEILLNSIEVQRLIDIDVINEPTAATIAGQEELLRQPDGIYVVCDIGGGTTDIVLIEKSGPRLFLFRPNGLAIAGDDVDKSIIDYLMNQGLIDNNIDYNIIAYEVKRAKEHLSVNVNKQVTVFGYELSRIEFERIIEPTLQKIVRAIKDAIKSVFDYYLESDNEFILRKIYLSGGGSKIPLIRQLINSDRVISSFRPELSFIRNKKIEEIFRDDTPIVMVAIGASRQKGGITDSVQHMLPFNIEVNVNNIRQQYFRSYTPLPINFLVRKDRTRDKIGIIATDQNNKEVYNLGAVLFSRDGIQLNKFLNNSNGLIFEIKINEQNIMNVISKNERNKMRQFNLPWQGGVEQDIFKKYRKDWRRKHGYL